MKKEPDVKFFLKYSPYIYGPEMEPAEAKEVNAQVLADYELEYQNGGYGFDWQCDPSGWPLWTCSLYKGSKDNVLLSHGGIDLGRAGQPKGVEGRLLQTALYSIYKGLR